jgi:UDP-N-acetylglucosamine 4,6-dehydratase
MIAPGSNILITGGTGSLGNAVARAASENDWPCKITIYSRNELRQAQMRQQYPHLRYVLGDVRDRDRLVSAFAGHDAVLHFAANKRVPECEAQPSECIQTNVLGTANVIAACQAAGVSRCVVVSTDKACASLTAYGASKRLAEALVTAAPFFPTIFTGVRYGNVLASNGSVIPIWRDQAARGLPLTITDHRCTRFWMTAQDAVDLVCYALTLPAGTIAVPKMGAMNILDMAQAIAPGCFTIETGLRSLEKLHEDLVHPDEQATETDTHYLLGHGTTGHRYTSDTARQLTRDELLAMLEEEAVPA